MVWHDEWLLEPLDDARQITEYSESSEVTEGQYVAARYLTVPSLDLLWKESHVQ